MKIEVKQEHIEKGQKGSPFLCPIAWAIREQTDLKSFGVTPEYIRIKHKYIWNIPKKVSVFIQKFDNDEQVKPFSFNLKI